MAGAGRALALAARDLGALAFVAPAFVAPAFALPVVAGVEGGSGEAVEAELVGVDESREAPEVASGVLAGVRLNELNELNEASRLDMQDSFVGQVQAQTTGMPLKGTNGSADASQAGSGRTPSARPTSPHKW
jgi:hypothetical protein